MEERHDITKNAEEERTKRPCETFEERPLGVNGLLKAFSTTQKYTGRLRDDLEEVIEDFETLCELCDVTDDRQKLKSIPIMLKAGAFHRYSKHKSQFQNYPQEIETLRDWYSSTFSLAIFCQILLFEGGDIVI